MTRSVTVSHSDECLNCGGSGTVRVYDEEDDTCSCLYPLGTACTRCREVSQASGIEPLVRESTEGGSRNTLLNLRVQAGTAAAIDELAHNRGWTRSDMLRHLLGKGMEAEGVR